MCGIAAVLSPAQAPRDEVDVGALRVALGRRGPDSFDAWEGPTARVWASRLVLWDEGASAQPFVADGLVGSFNGEVFNLEELRDLLDLPGASEVELLTRAVARHGPEVLRRVDGQFAGVVVDLATGLATAYRDRFGICPLYLAQRGSTTYVASNLESLEALTPGALSAWSTDGLAGVACEWAPPAPATVWSQVRQLVPGHAVQVRDGQVLAEDAWAEHPLDHLAPRGGGSRELLTLLEASVRSRTRSVGASAVSLSGGIDSTVIATLAVEHGVTASFGLVGPGDAEVEHRQRDIAARLGLEHHLLVLEPAEVLDDLVEFVSTRRVPLMRLGPVGMMGLARFVRRSGYTSVLCGEGADELFSGYDSYRVLAARAGVFGPVEQLTWSAFGMPEFGADRGRAWGTAYWRGLVAVAERADMRRSRMVAPALDLLSDDLAEAVRRRWDEESDLQTLPDPLGARRDEDLRRLLASYLLTVQGDHAWMEESVEQRPPWLSNDVAAWALARPAASHVSQAQGKLPVREVLGLLVERRPELSGLDFDKSAYRVDAGLLLADASSWDRFVDLVARAPRDVVDVPSLLARASACRSAGRCSEQESMVLTLAASLAVLAGAAR